jgi:hypothetical protein
MNFSGLVPEKQDFVQIVQEFINLPPGGGNLKFSSNTCISNTYTANQFWLSDPG